MECVCYGRRCPPGDDEVNAPTGAGPMAPHRVQPPIRPTIRRISGDGRVIYGCSRVSLARKQVGNAEAVAKIKANAAQRASDLAGIVDTLRAKPGRPITPSVGQTRKWR